MHYLYKVLISKASLIVVGFAIMNLYPLALTAQRGKDLKSSNSGIAEVNGTKLYYEIAGKGETVVLIHGSFGDRRFWDPQFNYLSKKHKVLRYDVRGYGKSALPNPNERYTDADDLNDLLNYLGIKEAHVCGLSLGSIIAIDFALLHPEKCLSLISCGPRVAGDGVGEYKTQNADTVRTIIARVTDIAKNKGAKEATDYLWTGDHVMSKGVVSPGTLQALLKMGYEYSWWRYLNPSKREYAFPSGIKQLSQIKIPTLVVTAEFDFELCKEVAAIIANKIPGAKLISINGAGHIMNIDRPKEFNKVISAFIHNVKALAYESSSTRQARK